MWMKRTHTDMVISFRATKMATHRISGLHGNEQCFLCDRLQIQTTAVSLYVSLQVCKYYANTASMQILIDKHPERILLMIIQNIIKIKDQITHFKLYLKLYLIQTHNNQTTSSAFCWQINKCANTPNIDKLYLSIIFLPHKVCKKHLSSTVQWQKYHFMTGANFV